MIRFFELSMINKIILTAMLSIVTFGAFAQDDDDSYYKKGTGKVFIFGASQTLSDSIVYLSSIQEIDGIDLEKKTKFLPYRSEFSIQMKEYLEGKQHLTKQTSCVYYSKSRKKISKMYYKLKKRYLDNPNTKIYMIEGDKFSFIHPVDVFNSQN